nr:hypothetical protein [Mycoplasmopsis bovis]
MNYAATVQKYINITLGALAGILVIAILIVGATAWFKASKADSWWTKSKWIKEN